MDKAKIINNVEKYALSVKDFIFPTQIILYGSYAKGTAKANSDIDVAVVVNKLNMDYLEASKMLYKLRRDIDDRIEPILIDETNDKSGFLKEIQNTGYVVYTKIN